MYRHIFKHNSRKIWAPNPRLHICGLVMIMSSNSGLAQVLSCQSTKDLHNLPGDPRGTLGSLWGPFNLVSIRNTFYLF